MKQKIESSEMYALGIFGKNKGAPEPNNLHAFLSSTFNAHTNANEWQDENRKSHDVNIRINCRLYHFYGTLFILFSFFSIRSWFFIFFFEAISFTFNQKSNVYLWLREQFPMVFGVFFAYQNISFSNLNCTNQLRRC